MEKVFVKAKFLPFTLTVGVVLLDQLTKFYIVSNWPQNSFIRDLFGNSFLQFIHVRNKAIAFSIGQNLPDSIKLPLFIVLPVIVLAFLLWYYFKTPLLTACQRWAVAGIMGGGFGNIIDRIFRPDGVVDFIDIRFFGIFGMERWPTFNVADASVVVCCLLLLANIIFIKDKNEVLK